WPEPGRHVRYRVSNGYKWLYRPNGLGGVDVGSVSIQSADITQDNVTIQLSGPTLAGQLTVSATGSGGGAPIDPIFNGNASAGTYSYSFGLANIPIGEYQQITAQWAVGNGRLTATFPFHFKVLGTYRQTRYNTPAESSCTGDPQGVTVYNDSCGIIGGTMTSGSVSRVAAPGSGTGSGHSNDYGDVKEEFYCATGPTAFRGFQTITGSLGTLNDSTVAACQSNPDLYVTGARVFIQGEGVKTVTDACPACCSDGTHLDNYSTSTQCSGLASLPNALTIRLY